MEDVKLLDDLGEALDRYDWKRADEVGQVLVAAIHSGAVAISPKAAKSVLGRLRSRRRFQLMQRVADALILSGSSESQVYRQYAQSLLDQGDLSAPLAVLEQMLGDPGLDPRESIEARGLKGRAYKQLYLASVSAAADRRRRVMKQAIDAYGQCYRERPDEHLWHGINLVALLARAERDGIAEPGALDYREIAGTILEVIEEKHEQKQANVFDFATAAEACVALGRPDEALKWTLRYTQIPTPRPSSWPARCVSLSRYGAWTGTRRSAAWSSPCSRPSCSSGKGARWASSPRRSSRHRPSSRNARRRARP